MIEAGLMQVQILQLHVVYSELSRASQSASHICLWGGFIINLFLSLAGPFIHPLVVESILPLAFIEYTLLTSCWIWLLCHASTTTVWWKLHWQCYGFAVLSRLILVAAIIGILDNAPWPLFAEVLTPLTCSGIANMTL